MNGEIKYSFDVIDAPVSLLGEGPVWDAETGTICWVDILNGTIYQHNVAHGASAIHFNETIGAVALCTNGRVLAALQSGIKLVDRYSGSSSVVCHPGIGNTENRYNDGKCDPSGRFWIGTTSLDGQPMAGSLYCVLGDGLYKEKILNVSISNGMAWSPCNTLFYYIDTPTFQVQVFDFDMETGDIANRRIAFNIPETEGYPDGMTADSEGMLWIAHWDGWQVARWNPVTGEKLAYFKLPVSRVSSCTFGGGGLTDLYISSARVGLTADELEKQPLAGSLFVLKNCGYKGLSTQKFNVG